MQYKKVTKTDGFDPTISQSKITTRSPKKRRPGCKRNVSFKHIIHNTYFGSQKGLQLAFSAILVSFLAASLFKEAIAYHRWVNHWSSKEVWALLWRTAAPWGWLAPSVASVTSRTWSQTSWNGEQRASAGHEGFWKMHFLMSKRGSDMSDVGFWGDNIQKTPLIEVKSTLQ